MTQQSDTGGSLAALAADPEHATIPVLWSALPPEDRRRAVELAAAGDRQLRGVLVGVVRQTPRYRSFRPASFSSWTPERLAGAVQQPGLLPVEIMQPALIALHLQDRAGMLAAFLDAVGVPHVDGLIQDMPETLAATPAQLGAAADALLGRFPADQVLTYILTLRLLEPELWAGLDSWLAARRP